MAKHEAALVNVQGKPAEQPMAQGDNLAAQPQAAAQAVAGPDDADDGAALLKRKPAPLAHQLLIFTLIFLFVIVPLVLAVIQIIVPSIFLSFIGLSKCVEPPSSWFPLWQHNSSAAFETRREHISLPTTFKANNSDGLYNGTAAEGAADADEMVRMMVDACDVEIGTNAGMIFVLFLLKYVICVVQGRYKPTKEDQEANKEPHWMYVLCEWMGWARFMLTLIVVAVNYSYRRHTPQPCQYGSAEQWALFDTYAAWSFGLYFGQVFLNIFVILIILGLVWWERRPSIIPDTVPEPLESATMPGWRLDSAHLQLRVAEAFDEVEGVADVDTQELVALLDLVSVSEECLALNTDFFGKRFYDKESLREPLQHLVQYCEGPVGCVKAGPDFREGRSASIRAKLQLIVKEVKEQASVAAVGRSVERAAAAVKKAARVKAVKARRVAKQEQAAAAAAAAAAVACRAGGGEGGGGAVAQEDEDDEDDEGGEEASQCSPRSSMQKLMSAAEDEERVTLDECDGGGGGMGGGREVRGLPEYEAAGEGGAAGSGIEIEDLDDAPPQWQPGMESLDDGAGDDGDGDAGGAAAAAVGTPSKVIVKLEDFEASPGGGGGGGGGGGSSGAAGAAAFVAPTHDLAGILVTLATYGKACHQQKEVGVTIVYELLCGESGGGGGGSLASHFQEVSVPTTVLRLLKNLREKLIEEQYCKRTSGRKLNTHPLIAYRNDMGPLLGVETVPDVGHPGRHWAPRVTVWDFNLFFRKFYTVERVTAEVSRALNAQPRKVGYDTAVEWFKAEAVRADERLGGKDSGERDQNTYGFLTRVYDEDTGEVRDEYVRWLLLRLGVFRGPSPLSPQEVSAIIKEGEDDLKAQAVTLQKIRASRSLTASAHLKPLSPRQPRAAAAAVTADDMEAGLVQPVPLHLVSGGSGSSSGSSRVEPLSFNNADEANTAVVVPLPSPRQLSSQLHGMQNSRPLFMAESEPPGQPPPVQVTLDPQENIETALQGAGLIDVES